MATDPNRRTSYRQKLKKLRQQMKEGVKWAKDVKWGGPGAWDDKKKAKKYQKAGEKKYGDMARRSYKYEKSKAKQEYRGEKNAVKQYSRAFKKLR